MLDAVTLDQLRMFVAVADEGSFSAAARRLKRVQSAVSQAMGALEARLGVTLWDRATRVPTLTERGRAILAHARRVCADVDALAQAAGGLAGGLEGSLSLSIDAVFPVTALVDLCRGFAKEFPSVDLRIGADTMAAVGERVLDGHATLGIVGPTGALPGLERRHLGTVRMVPVVAKGHPLARARGPVPSSRLAEHVQVVLSERTAQGSPDQAVLSPRTWRVGDLATKHALLRAGAGWGNLPEHMIRAELKRGALVAIRPEAWGRDEHRLPLSVVHRPSLAAGPATRWALARLNALCARDLGGR